MKKKYQIFSMINEPPIKTKRIKSWSSFLFFEAIFRIIESKINSEIKLVVFESETQCEIRFLTNLRLMLHFYGFLSGIKKSKIELVSTISDS